MSVKPKKHLGQHFLIDQNIARKTADLVDRFETNNILEIGPGTGMLTQFLLAKENTNLEVVEIDRESVDYLRKHYQQLPIHGSDFLKMDLSQLFGNESFAVIGNFPYNISSQILFKVLDFKSQIPNVAGMFQLELAQRVASAPNSKIYGVISVLFQAFYDIKLEFKIPPSVFNPPPKVNSAVIFATRKEASKLDCDHKLFKQIVKMSFNQRRKTIANSLKQLNIPKEILIQNQFAKLRPENLSVEQFVELTNSLHSELNP
jgi:16S rRNA (adenine1518-N6/adenine1519-N6)-dimethyltransferase